MCHQSDCGCEQHARPAPVLHHQGSCCCTSGYAARRFRTREEIAGELEEYLQHLRAEVGAVEERITELRKKG